MRSREIEISQQCHINRLGLEPQLQFGSITVSVVHLFENDKHMFWGTVTIILIRFDLDLDL